MADGELVLKLDDDLAQKIESGAAAAGMPPADFAQLLLKQKLFNYDDYVWDEDPRESKADLVEGEALHEFADVMREFRAEGERRIAARK